MSTQTMTISKAGLALIKRFEGFRAEAARLPDGRFVVGYGHVRSSPPTGVFTETQAAQALLEDLAPVEAMLNHLVLAPLAQSQFDALVSFAFSIGQDAFKRSDILRNLNAGQPIAAACAMDAWRKSAAIGEPQVIDVLVRRRAAEKALFLDLDMVPAGPSVFLRSGLDHAQAILSSTPIVEAPSLDAPLQEQTASAAMPMFSEADRLAAILEAEPQTAAVLRAGDAANDLDERSFDDVLELTQALSPAEPTPLAEAPNAPAPIAAAPPAKAYAQSQAQPRASAPGEGAAMERRAFALLVAAGLMLIGMGAWMLFTAPANGDVWFMTLSAPGVVVATMAGYYLAKAQTKRPAAQLPEQAIAR